jgi:uncharacterized protein YndB with AHSA1/START domain
MRSTIDLEKGAIRIEIEIEAPPGAVFDAVTDPKELETWWGSPETCQTQNWKNELRVGGERVCSCIGADGQETEVLRGEYTVVDRPNRVEFTWETKRDNYARTLVRIEIRKIAKGSLLVLQHSGFGSDTSACQRHGEGWKRVFGWLEAYVTRPQKSALPVTSGRPPMPQSKP